MPTITDYDFFRKIKFHPRMNSFGVTAIAASFICPAYFDHFSGLPLSDCSKTENHSSS